MHEVVQVHEGAKTVILRRTDRKVADVQLLRAVGVRAYTRGA